MLGAPIIVETAELLFSVIATSAVAKSLFDTIRSLLKENTFSQVSGSLPHADASAVSAQAKAISANMRDAEDVIDRLIKENELLKAEISRKSESGLSMN